MYPLYRSDFRNKAVDVFYLYLDYYIEEFGADQLLTVANVKVTGLILTMSTQCQTEQRWMGHMFMQNGHIQIVMS